MTEGQRRRMVISPLWLQGVVLTFIFGFAVLGYLAIRVYQDHAPVPSRVVSEAGRDGLHRRGHPRRPGAVPDLWPDAVRLRLRPRGLPRPRLHRRLPAPQALEMQRFYGGDARPQERVQRELQANRYDPDDRRPDLDRRPGQGLRGPPPALRRRNPQPRSAAGRAWAWSRPGPRGHPRASPPSSPGRPGLPRPAGPASPTRTRTTGPPNRWSATS